MQTQLDFISALADTFQRAGQTQGWQDKYRIVMQTGKALPALPDALRRDELLIPGCESKAWLVHQVIRDRHFWSFDSDARIIKGTVALLLSQLNGLTQAELQQIDGVALLQSLGLSQGLSPSRNNGLQAVLQRISAVIYRPCSHATDIMNPD